MGGNASTANKGDTAGEVECHNLHEDGRCSLWNQLRIQPVCTMCLSCGVRERETAVPAACRDGAHPESPTLLDMFPVPPGWARACEVVWDCEEGADHRPWSCLSCLDFCEETRQRDMAAFPHQMRKVVCAAELGPTGKGSCALESGVSCGGTLGNNKAVEVEVEVLPETWPGLPGVDHTLRVTVPRGDLSSSLHVRCGEAQVVMLWRSTTEVEAQFAPQGRGPWEIKVLLNNEVVSRVGLKQPQWCIGRRPPEGYRTMSLAEFNTQREVLEKVAAADGIWVMMKGHVLVREGLLTLGGRYLRTTATNSLWKVSIPSGTAACQDCYAPNPVYPTLFVKE